MKQKLLLLLVLLLSGTVYAQQLTITGTVTDAKDGLTIPGAHVILQGTSTVVVTDLYGAYSIKVPSSDATLTFSYLGYHPQDIKLVDGQTEVNVILEEELTAIDEVVVVGYGVTKKKLTTGANLNVKGDDVAKLNTASAMEALQGVAPGLSISRNDGAPGSGTKVNIRGIGTVGSSSPLYIVDGVEAASIDNINPLSIASIDVLKDAASAAIYGSRAANGVILVTTKKGQRNKKTNVSYSGYYGVQDLAYKPGFLNAQQYMEIQDEMRTNDGLEANDWLAKLSNNGWLDSQQAGLGAEYGNYIWDKLQNGWEGTDWLDEIIYEGAPVTSHTVNITGGGSKTTYAMGVSYYNQDGLIGGDVMGAGYERFTATFNADMILYETEEGRPIVTVGENMTYTNSKKITVASGNVYGNDLYNAIRTTPLMPAYWDQAPDDTKIAPDLDGLNFAHVNPLAQLYYNRNQFSDPKNNNILGNVYLKIEPIQDLVIRSSFGINASFGSSRKYTPTHKGFGINMDANTIDQVSQGMSQYARYTWSNTISWKKDIDKHHLNLLVGNEMNATMIDMHVNGSKKGSLYNDLEHAYLNNVPTPEIIANISTSGYDNAAQVQGLLSFMGRASYNYDDRYMVDVTMRADGSSNFADGKKWGYFPSVSAGWNFSEEEFMKDVDWLSYGKLRASWGQNGNQTLMNSSGGLVGFVYCANIATTSNGTVFGDNKPSAETSSYPSNVANPDVTWETSEQLNLGLDLRFFDSRLGVTFDWYDKITKDWLVVAPILGVTGAGAPFVNGGEIRNSGTELSVNWNDQVGDFTYGATLSAYTNVNEVTNISTASGYIESSVGQLFDGSRAISRVQVGRPIGYFYGYKTDGILQNQEEVDAWVNKDGEKYFSDARPGDIRFVDVNNDGVINDDDRTMIGNPNPDLTVGFQLNLGYKGAFINATMNGEFGMQVLNTYFWGHTGDNNLYRNWSTEIYNRWTGEGTSNKMARLSPSSHRNSQLISDASIYDADYFRMTNLTVGYNFAELFKDKSWVSNVTLYVSASNLFTVTDYKGFDPDVSYGGNNAAWGSGLDLGLYPLPRTFMVGLNLAF